MHKICNKYAKDMQRYARPANIHPLPGYERNMQEICRNMQYMQSGIKYAEYALPTLLMECWGRVAGLDKSS